MINAQEFTKLFPQLPVGFPVDEAAATDAWKIWSAFGQRFSGIAFEAAAKSIAIAAGSARETFSRLGEVTRIRDEPAEYTQALNEFAQGQFELSQRTADAFAGVMKQAQDDTAELVTTTGGRFATTGAEGTATATDKAAGKTRKAAK